MFCRLCISGLTYMWRKRKQLIYTKCRVTARMTTLLKALLSKNYLIQSPLSEWNSREFEDTCTNIGRMEGGFKAQRPKNHIVSQETVHKRTVLAFHFFTQRIPPNSGFSRGSSSKVFSLLLSLSLCFSLLTMSASVGGAEWSCLCAPLSFPPSSSLIWH